MAAALKGEIHNLLSVLRQNSRWASSERFVSEIPLRAESSLTRDLKDLREHIDDAGVDALKLVSPFVAVMVSSTTSGQMTGAALSSLHKFLLYGLIRLDSPRAKESINAVARGIVGCRFEETNRESDEVVLMKLLELTSVSLRCEAGPLIEDGRVAEMFFVCYRVSCHDSASELLRSSADNILAHMVLILFGGRLEETSEVLVEIMSFLSKISDPKKNAESACVLALGLVNIALESGGQRLGAHTGLVATMQGDLCRNLLQNSQTDDLAILSLTLRVIFNLFNSIKDHMKVQLEVFLISVHLRVLKQRTHDPHQTELVLESLLEFCREPVLMLDLYINYDCDVQCTNLFELVCTTLAEKATPPGPSKTVNVLNRLALEGVLAVIGSIARRCDNAPSANNNGGNTITSSASSNALLVAAKTTASSPFLPASASDEMIRPRRLSSSEDDLLEASSSSSSLAAHPQTEWLAAARERTAQVLQQRKKMKKRLALAAEFFNTSRTWIADVQSLGLLVDSDPAAIAKFLRDTPSLDRKRVGEYLSKGPIEEFPTNAAVLTEYVAAFDFSTLTFDAALRTFLSGFRLPGEAQCIDRMMEAFAQHLYAQWTSGDLVVPQRSEPVVPPPSPLKIVRSTSTSSSVVEDLAPELSVPMLEEDTDHRDYLNPFLTSDAAFVLAFSTIMLQTDLHNPAIKAQKRMTVDDFIRNNRGINDGQDLSREFLTSVYDAIKARPIAAPFDLSPSEEAVELAVAPQDWTSLVSRKSAHVSRAAFTPSSATKHFVAGVHERDMFQSIAEAAVGATLAVFERSVDAHLVLKTFDGLAHYAKICAYFELAKSLNQLLHELIGTAKAYLDDPDVKKQIGSSLSRPHQQRNEPVAAAAAESLEANRSDLASPSSSSDGDLLARLNEAEVERQPRPLLALEVALDVVRVNGNAVAQDTWARVVDVVLDLSDARALPRQLVQVDDVRLGPSLFASRCNAHWIYYAHNLGKRRVSQQGFGNAGTHQRASSGPSIGWISFLWRGGARSDDEDNDENSTEDEDDDESEAKLSPSEEVTAQLSALEDDRTLRGCVMRAVLRTGGSSFLERSSDLSLTTASALLSALTAAADPNSLPEARAALALEFAWRVVKANSTRAVALWPRLHALLANILGSPSTVSRLPYLAERCAIVTLRAAAHLDESCRQQVVRSLDLVKDLDPDVVAHIADRLALGAADVVRRCAFLDDALLDALLAVLDLADSHARGRSHVAAALVAILDASRKQRKFAETWAKCKDQVFANLDHVFSTDGRRKGLSAASAPAASAGRRSRKGASAGHGADDAALVAAVCGVQRLLVSLLDNKEEHRHDSVDLKPDILMVFDVLAKVRAPVDKATEAAVVEIVSNTRRLLVQRGVLENPDSPTTTTPSTNTPSVPPSMEDAASSSVSTASPEVSAAAKVPPIVPSVESPRPQQQQQQQPRSPAAASGKQPLQVV